MNLGQIMQRPEGLQGGYWTDQKVQMAFLERAGYLRGVTTGWLANAKFGLGSRVSC